MGRDIGRGGWAALKQHMVTRHIWDLRLALREMWVRVLGFAVLAVAAIALAQTLSPYLTADWAVRIGAEAVSQILGVLASSMLAVTTFSLSIAVSAFAAAAANATPRATALLQQDHTTQNVLATFLGAFIFALLGLIAIEAGLYSDAGRLVLFLATLLVVALVVIALIRWINHLMSFGRMTDTLDRVEAAATQAFQRRMAQPSLGGRSWRSPAPDGLTTVPADETGYVQHIDMQGLSACAQDHGVQLYLVAPPGAFVHPGAPLLKVDGRPLSEEAVATLQLAFSIGKTRTFDADPRFGLIVMSEIASRALSPSVNDPGTAIAVIGRLVRILSHWSHDGGSGDGARDGNNADGDTRERDDVLYPALHVAPLDPHEVLRDAFRSIARDGAGLVEVQLRLQRACAALADVAPDQLAAAAQAMSAEAMERARGAGLLTSEMDALTKASCGGDTE